MDGTHCSASNLAYASKVDGKVSDHVVSVSYVWGERKRKSNALDAPISLNNGSSLVPGLGHSPGFTSICLEKEMEEESCIDLGLSINPRKLSVGTSNEVRVKKPVLDLQLSLCTGAESDVTTIVQGFMPYQNCSKPPVDEGSTSSRWRVETFKPPSEHNLEIPIPLYPVNPVDSSITAVTPSPVAHSSNLANKQRQRNISVKSCQFEGCSRAARGASGFCITHGGGSRCRKPGCEKGAGGKMVFCKAHGGGPRCQHLGCTKSAEGHTNYCIAHGGGRRCNHDGCPRAARGKSGLCIRHGGGKRCKVENCKRSAEGISSLCISHGGGRRCQYPACTKGAQGRTMFCKAHGGGRRCTFLGCTKGAEGSTLLCKRHGGGKRCKSEGCPKSVHGGTLFCVSHGGGKRCAAPECTKSARGRTDYCVRHGGGKRCKVEGCPKSAQGSTDLCKAHGGGSRCRWGELGSCGKIARGKSGLCAAHSAELLKKPQVGSSNNYGAASSMLNENVRLDKLSVPEGRVHGGKLMAMLMGGAGEMWVGKSLELDPF